MDKSFSSAISFLPPRIQRYMFDIPEKLTENASEIRLRLDSPIALTVKGRTVLLTIGDPPRIDREAMEESFLRLCRNSVYSHSSEISNGYVTLKNGHRVGICGRAVTENDRITAVSDISAMNNRISRRHRDAAKGLSELLCNENGISSALIFGPPLSGKTTVLREIAADFARLGARVAVIDERRELFEHSYSCLDVFCGYPRKRGIEQAVRLFSPDLIIFDELGNKDDLEGLLKAVNTGAAVITTAHGANHASLKRRQYISEAVNGGIFRYFIELQNGEKVGKIKQIYGEDGEKIEGTCSDNGDDRVLFSRKNESLVL